MKRILLSNGQNAIVDDENYDRVNQYDWFAYKNAKGDTYAVTQVARNGEVIIIEMGSFVLSGAKTIDEYLEGIDLKKWRFRPFSVRHDDDGFMLKDES